MDPVITFKIALAIIEVAALAIMTGITVYEIGGCAVRYFRKRFALNANLIIACVVLLVAPSLAAGCFGVFLGLQFTRKIGLI